MLPGLALGSASGEFKSEGSVVNVSEVGGSRQLGDLCA